MSQHRADRLIARVNPRRVRSNDIGVIPLINIVLLLLIFFLIAGQMAARQEFRPPTSVSNKPIRYQPITLSLNTHQQLALNGEELSFEALGPALQAVLADDIQRVALKVDRDVTAGTLDKLLDVVRSHNIATVMLYSVNAEGLGRP
ncbi:MAG: biopolymer transporter ExbD [Desulfurellaceae bacterium]|nr:biopolymer transporter ExbD [Desulfurellaceae bacterium]